MTSRWAARVSRCPAELAREPLLLLDREERELVDLGEIELEGARHRPVRRARHSASAFPCTAYIPT